MSEVRSHTWGTHPQERRLRFPCDDLSGVDHHRLYRGVTIHAPPDVVFRWLCQMQAAPYSYDWLDNLGRRSPQTLTPGLDPPAVGATFMIIFKLLAYEPARFLTLGLRRPKPRLLEKLLVCYYIVPMDPTSCRLLVKLRVRYRSGLRGFLARMLLPFGDMIMMRRQLLNFKRLAEATAYLTSRDGNLG